MSEISKDRYLPVHKPRGSKFKSGKKEGMPNTHGGTIFNSHVPPTTTNQLLHFLLFMAFARIH